VNPVNGPQAAPLNESWFSLRPLRLCDSSTVGLWTIIFMLSIIIPAHNEAKRISATLAALHEACQATAVAYELIVVDDASEDDTAEIARGCGATVHRVDLRHIAATRNAGASIARYDWLCFVDADTLVPSATLQAAITALRDGAVGGGATVMFDTEAPRGAIIGMWMWNKVARLCRWAAGCFIFAQRQTFEQIGGFDETYYAAEEIRLSRAMKTQGKFIVLREHVLTSPRKFHSHSLGSYLKVMILTFFTAGAVLRKRDHLPQWYADERKH